MKRLLLMAAFLVAAAPAGQAQTQTQTQPEVPVNMADEEKKGFLGVDWGDRFAAGPSISTLGFGLEIPIKLNRYFVVRIGGNYFGWSMQRVLDGIDYDIDLDLASFGAAIDIHPFRNGLMLSAGYYWNGNGVGLTATPSAPITIGTQTFTPAQIGTLNGDVDFGNFSPFVGIGYDSTFYTDWRLSLVMRAGVLFQGDATVDMTTTGAGAAGLAAQLQTEAQELEDTLNKIGIFPVITIGLRYRF